MSSGYILYRLAGMENVKIFKWIHFRSYFIPGYIFDLNFYLDKLKHSISNINRKVDDGGGMGGYNRPRF